MTASAGVHLHTEAVLTPAGAVQLFLTDAKGDPIAASEASGTVTCEGAAPTTRTLAVTEDALSAECPALSGPTTLRYQLVVRGAPASGEIKVPATGTVGMAPPEHPSGHAHH